MLRAISSMLNRGVAVVTLGFVTWFLMSRTDDATIERRKEQGYDFNPKTVAYRREFMKSVDKKRESSS